MSVDPRAQFEQAVGGWRGAIESAVPALAFLITYQIAGRDADLALKVAGGLAALAAILRLIRRESLQFVIGGALGVAISAWFVSRTGRAEDFFLPDMIKNAAYGAVYLLSVLVRYPLIGIILGSIEGEPLKWIRDLDRRRTAMTATWLWVGMFAIRVGIMFPLYWAEALNALGVAKIALGYPLFILVVWLTYRIVRPWYRSVPSEDAL